MALLPLLRICPECKVGVVIEVNAETDFVAKNDKFVAFVKEATQVIMKQILSLIHIWMCIRDRAYPNLGFDDFISLEDMHGVTKVRKHYWTSGLVTDDSMADQIIQQYESMNYQLFFVRTESWGRSALLQTGRSNNLF